MKPVSRFGRACVMSIKNGCVKTGVSPRRSKVTIVVSMICLLFWRRPVQFDPTEYTIGQRIQFPMATGRRVEEQTLIYRGIKKITAENDTTYRCLIFSLVEYNKKGKEKEVITFYVTDDRNHLPVRLDMHLNFGSAKAFLKSVSGYRHPQTSIVTK